jgi:uncharacterized protein YcbX
MLICYALEGRSPRFTLAFAGACVLARNQAERDVHMNDGTVKELYMAQVKGARGERPAALHVDPAVGVQGDRRFAIKRRIGQPDTWAPKVHFRVCMNTPEMAAQTPVFVGGAASPDIALDRRWLSEVASALGESEVDTLDTKGTYNLVDTDPHTYGPTVSFLNLASLRALEAETGCVIEPERFRMNVWYDDDRPFSELSWADTFPGAREIAVGDLRLRIQDACERCLAIEANPATGRRDLPVLDMIESLLRKRGYAGSPHRGSFHVMGFLATPLTKSVIIRGQAVRLL